MIKTTAYRKPTNSDIYLNWNSFSLCSLRHGIFEIILRRVVYLFWSTTDYLKEELDHIVYVLEKFSNYSKWVIKQLWEEVKHNHYETSHGVLQINVINNDKKYQLFLLPYSGPTGKKIIRSMKQPKLQPNL